MRGYVCMRGMRGGCMMVMCDEGYDGGWVGECVCVRERGVGDSFSYMDAHPASIDQRFFQKRRKLQFSLKGSSPLPYNTITSYTFIIYIHSYIHRVLLGCIALCFQSSEKGLLSSQYLHCGGRALGKIHQRASLLYQACGNGLAYSI